MTTINFTNFNRNNAINNPYFDDVQQSDRNNEIFHDDGTFFIRYNGECFIFNDGFGQETPSGEYNRICNEILADVGITGLRVTGSNN